MTTPEQELAATYMDKERLFDAARELRKIDKEILTLEQEKHIEKAEICEAAVNAIKSEIDPSWTNLGESKKNGRSCTSMYHVEYKPLQVEFVMETVVEKSIVFPMLSAINEIDEMPSWLPSWKKPKFQFTRAETLERSLNSAQVFTMRTEAPLATVEFYVDVIGIDDTAVNKEFILNLQSMLPEDNEKLVPPPEEGIKRPKIAGCVLFSKCPADRVEKAKKLAKLKGQDELYSVSLSILYGNELTFLRGGFLIRSLANFMFKIVAGMMFSRLMEKAEEIRDGKSPAHSKAIEDKKVSADWIKGCIDRILE